MADDLVNVQIDGTWHQFPKGTRMIEACRQAGVEVPHYCYHPKLSSPGNCRMCLVEMGMPPRPKPGEELARDEDGRLPIQWMPRPVIACANTVSENLGIRTESALTKSCREGVMELLLINHPLDCPICDQAGECRLQEFSVEHGTGGSRFREDKVKKPKNVDIGPRVRLDDERCIMCSRCIRFTAEVADDPVLGFTERGSHTTLAVHPGRRLENNYSLNTVDICPVGALTSTDFRFQMRVWFLKETESICTGCGRGCNTEVSSREGGILRQTPRENNEVNSTWMCDRGRLDFHYVNSEARLTQPLLKGSEGHRAVSWEIAVKTLADKLAGFESSKIAIIASARLTNEDLYLVRRLAQQLGVKELDVVARLGEDDGYLVAADRNPNSRGAALVLGLDSDPGSRISGIRRDIESGKIAALLAIGEDLTSPEGGFSPALLSQLEFLGQIHHTANATADAAVVVLPGATSFEKSGSMVNVTGRLQRLAPVVPLPGEAREDWLILRDLLQALDGGNGAGSSDEVFSLLAHDVSAFEGRTLTSISPLGEVLIETGETVPLLEREKERVAKGEIVG